MHARNKPVRLRWLGGNRLPCALPVLGVAGCAANPVASKGEIIRAVADARSVVVASENCSVALIQDPAGTIVQIFAAIRYSEESTEQAEARVKVTKLTALRDNNGTVCVTVHAANK